MTPDDPCSPGRPGADPALLQAVLEHMPCIVLTIDEAYRIRFINRVPAGLTVDSVLGHSCLDYVDPAFRALAQQALDHSLRTGEPSAYEIRANGPHGSPAWYATTVLPMRGSGDGSRLALVTEDVTERRRCEQALVDREAQLGALLEATEDAVHVKDAAGRYVLVNRALGRLAGRDVDEILGRDDTAFLPPDAAREVMAEDRHLMASGETLTLQFDVVRPDGERRTLHARKGPLRARDGAVVGVFGIARDITDVLNEATAQRQALEESRNLLELALGASELGTWDADLLTGAVWRDDRLLRLLGYAREDLEPTLDQWWRLIHPDDRPAVEANRQAHLDGQSRVHESEHRLRHKEGHWVWVLETGKALRDAEGRPVRAIGTTRDISDRKRAASEGMELLRRIEVLVTGLGRASLGPAVPEPAAGAGTGSPAMPTPRGLEVLKLVAQGCTSADIGRRLGISAETASTHRRNLMRRLGLRNRAELIRYAVENGLVPGLDDAARG